MLSKFTSYGYWNGAGVIYSTLGGTHHTMEDIAVASAIPNMTIIAPCDPKEMELATEWCATKVKDQYICA